MKNIILSITIIMLLCCGCKDDFLEVKPNKNLLIPKKLSDLQAILDNVPVMNNYPTLSTLAADEIQLIDNSLTRVNAATATAYLWLGDNYQGMVISDWNQMYQQVFYANIVLDALVKIEEEPTPTYNQLKGSALFYRANAMFHLSLLFTKPYGQQNLEELGLPYPVVSDVNNRPGRSTISKMYQQLINDLSIAAELSSSQIMLKNRPSKQACYMLMARIYLGMADYENALKYAKMTLATHDKLVDYNIAKTGLTPFPVILPNGNDEVIFYQKKYAYTVFNLAIGMIEPSLASSFNANDLRRKVTFYDGGNNTIYFAGFEGLTTGETYLIAAECTARLGELAAAANYLNKLTATRFKTNTYIPYQFNTTDEALTIIIAERRKELFARGLRWFDLRRLNLEPKFATTIKRVYNGVEYILAPNSAGYVFKIPDGEIQTSGIAQN